MITWNIIPGKSQAKSRLEIAQTIKNENFEGVNYADNLLPCGFPLFFILVLKIIVWMVLVSRLCAACRLHHVFRDFSLVVGFVPKNSSFLSPSDFGMVGSFWSVCSTQRTFQEEQLLQTNLPCRNLWFSATRRATVRILVFMSDLLNWLIFKRLS